VNTGVDDQMEKREKALEAVNASIPEADASYSDPEATSEVGDDVIDDTDTENESNGASPEDSELMGCSPASPLVNSKSSSRIPGDGPIADSTCILKAVNTYLSLSELNGTELSMEHLFQAQRKLHEKNPTAHDGAYGCSDPTNPSFTMEVTGVALRKLFPNHYVTIRNLCKKGGNVKELQQKIARLCRVPAKKRGNNFWLVDGCLNKAWFKSEDTKDHTQLESALSQQETALNAVREAQQIDPRNLHACEVDLKSAKEAVKAARNAIAEWRHVVQSY